METETELIATTFCEDCKHAGQITCLGDFECLTCFEEEITE